jgi:hypothetical protein
MFLPIFGVFAPRPRQEHGLGPGFQWIVWGRRRPESSPRHQAGKPDVIFEEMPKNSGEAAEKWWDW